MGQAIWIAKHPASRPSVRGNGKQPRWIAAGDLHSCYGSAKVNNNIHVIDSEVTKPLGEVSGFWLTSI